MSSPTGEFNVGDTTAPTVAPMAGQGGTGSDPKQLAATYQAQMQQAIQNKAAPQANNGTDWLAKPIEWAGAKMYSVYSKYISRPVTTALLATGDLQANGQGSVFSGDTWDRAYRDAKNVSPGQVLYANFIKDPTGNEKFETGINRDGTLIWDHPDQVKAYYDHGIQQWTSGGLDAGFSWFADPLVLAGKGLKVAKDVSYVRPAVDTANPTLFGKVASVTGVSGLAKSGTDALGNKVIGAVGNLKGSSLDQVKAAQDAWTSRIAGNNIDRNLNSSTFTKFGDYIESNKAKLADQFPAWATGQKWALSGGNASGIAAALYHATDRTQIDEVLKTAMGDQSTISRLTQEAPELKAELEGYVSQRNTMYSNLPKFPDPNSPAAQQLAQQIASHTKQINDIEAATGHISRALDAADQMKHGMFFTPGVTPAMAKLGQQASTAYASAPMSLLYSNFFVRPVRMVNRLDNLWNNVKPKGWVALDDPNSYREVDAQIRESGMYGDIERSKLVSDYIAAPNEGKRNFLYDLESKTLGRMAAEHGVTEDAAKKIYSVFSKGRANYISGANIYGGSRIQTSLGTDLNVSHIEDDGNIIATHPVFATQLENNHPMMDFSKMKNLLKYNGGAFNKLLAEGNSIEQAGNLVTQGARPGLLAQGASQKFNDFTDLFNHLWKFQAHLRLGYGPRALSDDFLGQVATLGAYTKAEQVAKGFAGQVIRRIHNPINSMLYDYTGAEAHNISLNSAMSQLEDDLLQARTTKQNIAAYVPQSGKAAARQQQMLVGHQQKIDLLQTQLDGAKLASAQFNNMSRKLMDKQIITPGGQVISGAGEGARGRLFADLASGRSTIDSAYGGTASHLQGQIRGNAGWTTVHPGEEGHLGGWLRVVQRQIANDPAGMLAVKGQTPEQIANWLNGQGRSYFKSLTINNMTTREMADRIHSEVNYQLPDSSPEFKELRQAVVDGKDDTTIGKLMAATQQAGRPEVNAERSAYGMGKGSTIQMIDDKISKWYHVMAEKPANVLSKNPVFATLYKGHVQDAIGTAQTQGITHFAPEHLEQIEENARKLALADVKKLTYNMDFETKITHANRFIAPFFGPMQEAFNRWARILSDKPATLAHAGQIYTSPGRIGHAYTYNGDPIVDGYTIDPATGKKVLVDKSDTYIRFQLPGAVRDAFGLGATPVAQIPLNSLNIAMQNSPWYNPGEGPIVQMAANHFAVKADPRVGDFFQKIGVLPQGITAHDTDALWGGVLRTINKANDDGTAQQMTLQALQQQQYMYSNGLRTAPPSLAEAKKSAENSVMLKAWFSGTTVLPFGVSFQDPYQFFRDQYRTMRAADPKNADANFYAKYGDSAYAFTSSLSKNNIPGVPATQAGQRLATQFKSLIDADPELAGVIIGDQGGGDYSQTAYMQQVISGQRTKLSAKDAFAQGQANTGWQQYTSYMNGINAQLFQRGLQTLNDKGAEDLLAQKRALVTVLSHPYQADGVTKNPYYNEAWTQAYNTTDPSKDDRRAIALADIATAKELQNRPDIQALQQYLNLRGTVKAELAARAGDTHSYNFRSAQSATAGTSINDKSNDDLKAQFQNGVMQLIEGNTYFQTLHDKYLSKDMFDHYDGTGITNPVTGEAHSSV